ncbi:MAG: transketolase [Chloroflexi bacterium]|nr:transketolase [Chloroflexota bacterium]
MSLPYVGQPGTPTEQLTDGADNPQNGTKPGLDSLPASTADLKRIALELRRQIVIMIGKAGSGHPGGSLSAVEIVTSLLFAVMRHDPANPKWPGRDRLVLSKGHAAPVLYAALATAGYFPKDWLNSLRKIGSPLQGHPYARSTPGVEISTGSLGQGLSVAVGMALAGRLDRADYRVYAVVGDGESDEGQIWEAAMAAGHYRLDNLVGILDYNGLQIDGPNREVMNVEPLADKWRSFGWHVQEVDGHDFAQLLSALATAADVKGQPSMIVARTTKGKGVSFMENVVDFHGKAPTAEQVELALRELIDV